MFTVEEIIKHFKGAGNLAHLLTQAGSPITRQAIYMWGDYIPELRAHQILRLSNNKFTFEQLPVKGKAA